MSIHMYLCVCVRMCTEYLQEEKGGGAGIRMMEYKSIPMHIVPSEFSL